MTHDELDAFVLHQTDDALRLICDTCSAHICDAESGDTLSVLARTAQAHDCDEQEEAP